MKKFLAISLVITFTFTFLISCSHKSDSIPSKIIPKDKMADVLVDVHLAEASADNHGLSAPQVNMMMAAKYDSLFKKHEITFAQFKSSYDYYLAHPDVLSEIYSEVVNKLTTMESKATSDRKIKLPKDPERYGDSPLTETPPIITPGYCLRQFLFSPLIIFEL